MCVRHGSRESVLGKREQSGEKAAHGEGKQGIPEACRRLISVVTDVLIPWWTVESVAVE